ncbi:hypothetical protein ID866_3973 [Astraeus odoratus]|nr:hypothetical protein ID866_3973 [Astraeus odoratus]
MDCTIHTSTNVEIPQLNSAIPNRIARDKEYPSVESVANREYKYFPQEALNSLDLSGFPLHKPELKIWAPLMLLRNVDPIHCLHNGTRLKLIRCIGVLCAG